MCKERVNTDANHSFGAWLKKFRRQHNLNQEELAEQLGFSAEYIRKLESNRRPLTLGVAQSVAAFLELQDDDRDKLIEDLLTQYAAPDDHESQDGVHYQDPAPGVPPYKGLDFFAEADADLFFGRKALAAELVTRLAAVSRTSPRFLAVIGASGSGKSSAVRAGLVPLLRNGAVNGSDRWLISVSTPTAQPLRALAGALTAGEQDTATTQLLHDLRADSHALDRYAAAAAAESGRRGSQFLVIVDQFEELFTLCRHDEARSRYIDSLLTAAQSASPAIVIIILRADFYRHCLEYEQLRVLLERHTITIGAMKHTELREAIVCPAAANGWEFEPGLADALLRDVTDEPGALPLLSHALRETWERRAGRTLTLAGYGKIGRVQGAIATTADRVFGGLSGAQQMTAKRVFLRLTELGEGAQDTRRRVALAELLPTGEGRPDVAQTLKTLADARLVTLHREEAEVAHEALIREWPLLLGWLSDNRKGLQAHRRLTESANEWRHAGCDPGILFRGSRLELALRWAQERPEELNDLEREFLAASIGEVESQQRAEEEARIRELDHQRQLTEEETKRAQLAEARAREAEEHAREQIIAAAQLRRRRNFLIVAGAAALCLAAIALWFGMQSARSAQAAAAAQTVAESSARVATADRLAMQARILSAGTDRDQLDLALLMAVEAVTTTLQNDGFVLPNAELALTEASDAVQPLQWHAALILSHPDKVFSAAFSPDGLLVVSAGAAGRIRIWDLAGGKEVRQLSGHTGSVRSAVFSPDGKQIASGGEDGTVRIWDAASGQAIRRLAGHQGAITSVAFAPDGQRVVSAGEDEMVRSWDITTGQELRRLAGHTGAIRSAAYSPDGEFIVSAGEDHTVRIWDAASGREVRRLVGHSDQVSSAAYSRDGEHIVTAGDDKRVRIWDAATGAEIHILYTQTGTALAAAYSPDGRQVVGAVEDGLLRVWDATSERETQQLTGHTAPARAVAFSPDGMLIASAGEDGAVRIWRRSMDAPLHQLRGHTESVRRAAFSPDGKQLISASEDATIRIWDASSGRELRELAGHTDSVRSALFSPDGQQIVSAGEDGTVRIWDAASGKEVRNLLGHAGAAWSAIFSPDGRLVASTGEDGTLRIWDVAGGRQIRQVVAQEDSVWSVAFSPDGEQIAGGCAVETVCIWAVATGELVHKMPGDLYGIWSVVFSPDGRRVAAASDDGTVRIWDAAGGQEVQRLAGQIDGVRSVAFSPDGRHIVSAGADKTVRVWDVNSGRQLRQLVGHTERVLSADYSPDGRQIASSSADTTIRLWGASIEEELAHAEALIQRQPPALTTEERQQYGLQPAAPGEQP